MSTFSDGIDSAREKFKKCVAWAIFRSWESMDDESEVVKPADMDELDWFWCLGYARAIQEEKMKA